MTNKSQKIKLSPSMDIMAAEDFKQQLLGSINSEADVIIDASAVDRITTPCIQLLLASELELKSHNKNLKIFNASGSFVSALEDIGLQEQYEQWSAHNE